MPVPFGRMQDTAALRIAGFRIVAEIPDQRNMILDAQMCLQWRPFTAREMVIRVTPKRSAISLYVKPFCRRRLAERTSTSESLDCGRSEPLACLDFRAQSAMFSARE